ncbi:MAG: acylphosphatase [Candidatus Woesearchaeota archaeon]|nr:acylphosphatase [Candidatus Woesearchaeota archaeon]
MKQVHLRLYGDVQGVGFRFFIRQQAKLIGVKGFVRNLKDCVEVVANGSDEKILVFSRQCKRGPIMSRIERSEEEEMPIEEFEDFEIRL